MPDFGGLNLCKSRHALKVHGVSFFAMEIFSQEVMQWRFIRQNLWTMRQLDVR